jgi:DNA/RNA-binding domain of Phe-tRNA-synthetase-like protein
MTEKIIRYSISDNLLNDGIKVALAIFSVPKNSKRRGNTLEKHIKTTIKELDIDNMLSSDILKAYKELYRKRGLRGTPPAEHLLLLVKKVKMLPNINKIVDCCNIVSLKTLLSVGAHDVDHIKGDIRFTNTDGTEKYTPLGKDNHESVTKNEYACLDEEKILCRMDLKNCDETKIRLETISFLVYVQGNKETSQEYVDE